MLSKDVRTWPEARVKCEKLGGSLAIIKDGETNKFITNLIRSGKHVSTTDLLTFDTFHIFEDSSKIIN